MAVKFYCPDKDGDADKQHANIMREVSVLTAVQQHPNIIGFHGIFHAAASSRPWPHQATYALLMEHCDGGDLARAMVRRRRPFPEKEVASILRCLLSALAHVHSRSVVHRDVKPENMFLKSDGNVILADFGLACFLADREQMSRRCGSPGYSAPELVMGAGYSEKVDVFAAGVVLHFLITCTLPFHGPDTNSTLRRTIRCQVKFEECERRWGLSHLCKSCILCLLAKSPRDRPSPEAALSHSWFQREHVSKKTSFDEQHDRALYESEESTHASGTSSPSPPSECSDHRCYGYSSLSHGVEESNLTNEHPPGDCPSSMPQTSKAAKMQKKSGAKYLSDSYSPPQRRSSFAWNRCGAKYLSDGYSPPQCRSSTAWSPTPCSRVTFRRRWTTASLGSNGASTSSAMVSESAHRSAFKLNDAMEDDTLRRNKDDDLMVELLTHPPNQSALSANRRLLCDEQQFKRCT
jgi:serine/threonine protein kinase